MKSVLIVLFATLALAYAQDKTCSDIYTECREKAVVDGSFTALANCLKDYTSCRGAPAIACVKQCHASLKSCLTSSASLLEKAQCGVDALKCTTSCKLAPHDDVEDIMADDVFSDFADADDKSCSDKYTECREKAVVDGSFTALANCLKDYTSCRGAPAIACVKQCHASLKSCLTSSASLLEKAQCGVDALKCTTSCKLAPHDDVEDIMADDDFSDFADADDKSCSTVYNECRGKAVADGNLKLIYECGKEYLKCRGSPLVSCIKTCHTNLQTCRAASSGLDKAQCWIDLAKCAQQCKLAPHDMM